MSSANTAGLRVLSSLGQGQVAGPVAVAGNTLTPAAAYLPGELVSATATKAVRSATGAPLVRPYVWQFAAAATGGNAQFGGSVRVQFSMLSNYPLAMRLADIDGDGDLDIITSFNANNNTNYSYSQPLLLNVQRNNGRRPRHPC